MSSRLKIYLGDNYPLLKVKIVTVFDGLKRSGLFAGESDPLATVRSSINALTAEERFIFLIKAWALAWELATGQQVVNKPNVIIIPGYWYKYAVTESLLGLPLQKASFLANSLPLPNLTVFFKADVETLAYRKSHFTSYECGLEGPGSPEAFCLFQQKMVPIWESLKQEHKSWESVDAQRNEDQVFADILSMLGPLILNIKTTGKQSLTC
jgi:thymidylate kinase